MTERYPRAKRGDGHLIQFTAYLVSGGIAALFNICSRVLLGFVLSYEVAIVLAYGVGMAVAFTIMRALVFQPPAASSKRAQLVRFSIVNLLGLLQTLLVSELVADWVAPALGFPEHAELIGHGLGVGVPIVSSYFGHEYFSFRKAGT
jgi:putative flippase GtrA